MKISFFIPSLRGGGAERMFLNLANSISRKGYSVDLVLVSAEGPYLSDVSGNVNIIDFKKKRVLHSLPVLIRYLSNKNPDVLISAMNHANLIALLAKKFSIRCETHIYVSIRNTLSKTIEGDTKQIFLFNKLMRYLYSRADKIVTVSEGVAVDFKKVLDINSAKIQTIYNPVINDTLLAKAKEVVEHPWFQPGSPALILGVGRLTEQKDFQNLIRAFSIVSKKEDARLVILGEGEERRKLETLALELGISKKVDLPGFVDNPFKYMRQADVFVLSSRWEGLSDALIEAMACGATVISTDCPSGPREILNNGEFGILVPVGEAESLAKAIVHSIENKYSGNSERGLGRFKEEKILGEYLELIGA